MIKELLSSALKGKKRAGQKDLINYLRGKKLTRNQAIKAKCYDCNGMGELNRCDTRSCVLYPFSPYSKG